MISAVTIAPAPRARIVPRRTRRRPRTDRDRAVLRIDTDTMYDGEGATRATRTRARPDIPPLDSNKFVSSCIYVHKIIYNIHKVYYNCVNIVTTARQI